MAVTHTKPLLNIVGAIVILSIVLWVATFAYGGGAPLLVRAHNSPMLTLCLLELGADPNIRDERGDTPLVAASRAGNIAVMSLLIDHHADPNKRGGWSTPLQAAVCYETHTIYSMTDKTSPVLLLLRHGARVNMRGKAGSTPLELAARFGGGTLTMQRLLAHGADPARALLYVSDQHDAELLIKHGASITVRDQDDGRTPLHIAVLTGNIAFVKTLIAHGADTMARDKSGATPLHMVLSNNSRGRLSEPLGMQLIEELLRHQANPNVKDHNGQTPLHKTALNTCQPNAVKCRIAQVLLTNGARISSRDNRGLTALDYALEQNDNHRLVEILQAKKHTDAYDARFACYADK